MKTWRSHPLFFYLCHILFWLIFGYAYCVVDEYNASTYFEGFIYIVIGIPTVILVLSYCIAGLLNLGLKDGSINKRVNRIQIIFGVLFLLYWLFNIYKNKMQKYISEQTINECFENNVTMVTLPFYNGGAADSVYQNMIKIDAIDQVVDTDFTAVALAYQLLDKEIKDIADSDIDTIYCIDKLDINRAYSVRNDKLYVREVWIQYNVPRRNIRYKAKYTWRVGECVRDSVCQMN